jgi:hypothetical protein
VGYRARTRCLKDNNETGLANVTFILIVIGLLVLGCGIIVGKLTYDGWRQKPPDDYWESQAAGPLGYSHVPERRQARLALSTCRLCQRIDSRNSSVAEPR